MDRTKLLAIALAGVACVGTITFLAGTANAATWHDYKGDIFAGHAYGLDVPAGAHAYEIALSGGPSAAARVAAFDPHGAKLGFYSLSKDLTTASVVAPLEGTHMLYVYDVVGDGALTLRVDSDKAPAALDLKKIELQRTDVPVGDAPTSDKLDKAFTTTLPTAPVFVTLLYEGSAQDLNANVASVKGDVVAIAHETGTAFSPGVWSSLSGDRTSTPANLDGTAYTVTVHAAKFEGTMVLTALSLDLAKPTTTLPPTETPPPTPVAVTPAAPHVLATAALAPSKATAFHATAGTLVLEDAKAIAAKEKDANASGYAHDSISVFSPDDKLLQFVTLDAQHPSAKVVLPADGEYVAYVHDSTSLKGVVARFESVDGGNVRELPLQKETKHFDLGATFLQGNEVAFVVAHAPVAMRLAFDDGTLGALAYADVRNDKGVVAQTESVAPTVGLGLGDGSTSSPARFEAGPHLFRADGIAVGQATLTTVWFSRAVVAPPTPVAPPAPAQPSQPDAPSQPPQPDQPSQPSQPDSPTAPGPFPGLPPF